VSVGARCRSSSRSSHETIVKKPSGTSLSLIPRRECVSIGRGDNPSTSGGDSSPGRRSATMREPRLSFANWSRSRFGPSAPRGRKRPQRASGTRKVRKASALTRYRLHGRPDPAAVDPSLTTACSEAGSSGLRTNRIPRLRALSGGASWPRTSDLWVRSVRCVGVRRLTSFVCMRRVDARWLWRLS